MAFSLVSLLSGKLDQKIQNMYMTTILVVIIFTVFIQVNNILVVALTVFMQVTGK